MSSIESVLEFLKIDASASAVSKILRYSELVIEGNARVNVTGSTAIADFIAGPLFDALTLIPVWNSNETVVDIGSGGGLPAVPLAILFPLVDITLVEPRSRRVAFLKEVVQALSLSCEVRLTQDRELPAAQWGAAVSQAVFPPPLWIKRGRRLVRSGGCLYVLSSSEISQSSLPPRCRLELQQHWCRPIDGAQRFSSRIRVG